MFHYAIPLRAKQTSNDWNEVCVRLEATIKSIEGAGGDYRIVVACHDIPEFISGYQNPRTELSKSGIPSRKIKMVTWQTKHQKKMSRVEKYSKLQKLVTISCLLMQMIWYPKISLIK